MRKISILSGSRADFGLLEWPEKVLRESQLFQVETLKLWGYDFGKAYAETTYYLTHARPSLILILGDRFEVLAAATAAHLQRVPIAHIAGGDVTAGSYDDAMRDAISRMAHIHFTTSTSAMARLSAAGYRNVHLVGNPGIDYIRRARWKGPRPIAEPYSVISYQPETLTGTNEIVTVLATLPAGHPVFILPNPDRGSQDVTAAIRDYARGHPATVHEFLPHAEFLNLLQHCEEFIGNSSAMLYEAPELGIRTRMIGNRQGGRTIPWGDGLASQRMLNILKYTA